MICSYKKSRKQGRFTLASVELATELPFFVCPFFEFNERVLRQNCHLYANFEGDKEKTRARVVAVADRAKDDGEQKGMTESERGLSPTESTHVVTRSGEVPLLLAEEPFLRRLTRCARPGQTEGKRLLLLERNARRVATILLCISFGRPL